MLAGRQFRDNAAIRLMHRNLRSHDVREHLLAGAHHGRSRLVAGTLDTEDVGRGHETILLEVRGSNLMADLLKQVAESGFSAEFSTAIVQTLRQRGFQAYLVGGCVRDLLLGREPKDYDVATNATPEQVMAIFPETYAVGAQFGVVLVPMPEALQARDVARNVSTGNSDRVDVGVSTHAHAVEVATFRSDIGYSEGGDLHSMSMSGNA